VLEAHPRPNTLRKGSTRIGSRPQPVRSQLRMRYPRCGWDAVTAMSASTLTSPLARQKSDRPLRRSGSTPKRVGTIEVAAEESRPLELDTASSHWQLSLDRAQRALRAAGGQLPAPELGRRQRELAWERQETAKALRRLAKVTGVRPMPWLSPVPVTANMLGLPATTRACLFDLDGVLTDSAVLHAWAWGEVFDEFLLRLSEKTGWQFIPFERETDYSAYIDGRTRLEGIHAFLDSRGIRLREGRVDDPVTADSAEGLAKRKGEVLSRGLRQHGVAALAGARRYLEATGHAGLARAVVSASTSTLPMLELANLATLVEERVDAEDIRSEGLRSRPAPDLLVVACRRLGVKPEEAVTFTHSAAGVAAGHAAGLGVIGVGDREQRELLQGFGAEEVVPSLSVLLDHQLSGGANIPAELDQRRS
jgi:beta-phosphoglucomutase-like phosphatase (HAD superfamily)